MTENENLAHEQFLQYFSRDRNRLYRYIYSMVAIEADAEDVFQQTSIVLWKKFGDFDQDRVFFPWASKIAFHCVLNFRRSAKRRRMVLSDELVKLIADKQTQQYGRNQFRHELLRECLTQLGRSDSELIADVYQDRTPVAEVARKIERAPQTIYNRLNLIRKQLIQCVNRKLATGES